MDWTPYLKAAQDAAGLAGRMLVQNRDTAREVIFKGAVDLVTNFDRRSQAMIIAHLSGLFPDHDFLAEEGLSHATNSHFCWIIDPIDGTTNFAHGYPVYSVSIALQKDGQTVVGVIYDPTRDEMFSAAGNQGAHINGHKISVSITRELTHSLLSTGFPYDIRESSDNNLDHFADLATRAQAVRRCGSAALDLSYVACGRLDGFWELKLSPWDVAAGILIVWEAGGQVSDFRGGDPDIFGKEIVASNGQIHDSLLQVLTQRRQNKYNQKREKNSEQGKKHVKQR